jgi:putative ABC transport system ATP-binding protein
VTPAPLLELRGVARTYPGPTPVDALRGCDLVVEAGELLAIVGPSGSGKSTLLHLLGLLDRPTAGELLLRGRPTSTLSEAERCGLRAHELGFVFQSFHLLEHRSAVENVELGLLHQRVPRRERRQRALHVIDQVGLRHRRWAAPSHLSGGERQRVAVARAVVRRPSLVLCDEPTGNLDAASGEQVLRLLEELHSSGLTVVVITHDLGVAARASRTVELRDGRLRRVTAR